METSDLQVTMANELIRAAHNLSLMEKRVLMLAVSKLDSSHFNSPFNPTIDLSVTDFTNEFGINQDSAYRELKKAVRGVRKRYVRFFYKNKRGAMCETDVSWTTKATYTDREGLIQLSLNRDLSPLLIHLKGHFTQYKLSRAGALRSVYSWRLFELLMQFKRTGILKIDLDEFYNSMEAAPTYRKDFGLLRTRIIEPAVKEIREKDGLKVKWEAIKTGRKVTALKFTFPVEQQNSLPLPKPIPPQPKPPALTKAQEAAREKAADLAHLKKLAELSGEPLEKLLKRP